ncbi:MAG: hypothetical protein HQM16_15195 [Deltaproteobacteria bacterium]|nr:hypothetical protein [Deltaproteobacteria bacterium]
MKSIQDIFCTSPLKSAFVVVLIVFCLLVCLSSAKAKDPANANECKTMLKTMLLEKCNTLFATAEQADAKASCLKNIDASLASTCDKFFGKDSDFCSVCTNGCINNYQETDPERTNCLKMCLAHAECQKK